MRERLEPEIFRLPVERLREGYYSDAYFNFTKQLLEERDLHPRVLMQVFQKDRSVLGGTVAAARDFAERFADEMNVTVLVDFDNDSVRTSLEVADALGEQLWGVRLDTSENLVDRALLDEMGAFRPTGVNPVLVERVREALDAAGHEHVKIVVSGGFDSAKIRSFEELGAPVDAYGVGSSLLRGSNDFTADVVEVDGRPCAKVGRVRWPSDRLERVV